MKSEKQKREIKFLGNIAVGVCFIVILGVIASQVENFRRSSSYFRIQNIDLRIDSQKVENPNDAFVYLNIKKGSSIFEISPSQLVKDIRSRHPEVREVKVKKQLPSTLFVDVKNRIAVAQIHLSQFYPVDSQGFLLPYPSNFRLPDLPCLEGIDARELKIGIENKNSKLSLGLKVINLLHKNFPHIYRNIDIDVSDRRNIILYLPQGPKVRLAEYKLDDKIAKLKLVLGDIQEKNINPELIDLRFEKAILIPRNK